MVRSMTGYGKAESLFGDRKITIEIKTLNSKQLDLSLKMPSCYRQLDTELRNAASKTIVRGKADVYINIECLGGSAAADIDKELYKTYYNKLKEASEYAGMEWDAEKETRVIPAVLRMPDVVATSSEDLSEEEAQVVVETFCEAASSLDEFRKREGSVLIADILGRVKCIGDLKNRVEPYECRRIDVVKNRLNEHLEALAVSVDRDRFEQEVIYYLEKYDITEEKVRLQNHCNYFEEIVKCEENPGRKLGFITQEMGREINTLGSKANDSDIQHIVVQMKDELEKIKEQLLNIL